MMLHTFLRLFRLALQIRPQSYSIHATINLEVKGILSELFWSHVILDNTIKFRWNGICRLEVLCVSRVRLVVSTIHLVSKVENPSERRDD